MGKNYTYGYKDSHSQMKIPKFSPTWQAWRAGKIKPKPYFDCTWFWELTIEYYDLNKELMNDEISIYRQLFDYRHREYAVNTRDIVTNNNPWVVKNVRIRLVRL